MTTADIRLASNGLYLTQIVGTSHYQDNLNKIYGAHIDDGIDYKTTARLIYDNKNPYDKKAVKIEIDGLIVGHLDKEAARYYRTRMTVNGQDGMVVSCPARILSGCVTLDLPDYLGSSPPVEPKEKALLADVTDINSEELAKCQVGEVVHLWVNKRDASQVFIYRRGTCGGDGRIGQLSGRCSSIVATHLIKGGGDVTEIVEIKHSRCKLSCKLT